MGKQAFTFSNCQNMGRLFT